MTALRLREVAVPAPLPGTLTYQEPDWARGRCQAGMRLLVPLQQRLVTGYDLGPASAPAEDIQLRSLADLLDTAPVFPPSLIPLFRWLAQYYHCPIGEVIRTACCRLHRATTRRIRLRAAGRHGS